MILSCPSCTANFTIDPSLLGAAGRKVRCAKCKHEWLAIKPIITLPPDDHTPEPFHVTPRAGIKITRKKPPSKIARRNAVLFGIVLALFLALPVMGFLAPKKTDPSHVSGEKNNHAASAALTSDGPITLDGVPATLLKQDQGRNILSIEGALLNKSDKPQKLPLLKAEALDAKRRVIRQWVIPLATQTMEPGQRLPFTFTTPFNEQGVVDIAFHFEVKKED